jgi:hypothetical protein
MKFDENWVTTTTNDKPDFPANIDMQYTSKGKIYYGVHTISVSIDGDNRTYVKAKFDTGARSSSIDFSVAKRLGISDALIEKCKELDRVIVPKTMPKAEQLALEKKFTTDLQREFPEVTSVQGSRSSSGFSIRAYVRLNVEYDGRVVVTEANLRDRTGLSCEMLVGLKDML